LKERSFDVWIDRKDIPPVEDFAKVFRPSIMSADNFIFVISSDSVMSPYCAEELAYALELQKRIIPIAWRFIESQEMHDAVPSLAHTGAGLSSGPPGRVRRVDLSG
jgi:hypothetical protein